MASLLSSPRATLGRLSHARSLAAAAAAAALPDRAQGVVVGGGIIGTSTAYHLAKRGLRPVTREPWTIDAQVYNAVLRRFPQTMLGRNRGNCFTNTISSIICK